jgi:hypothetical protein
MKVLLSGVWRNEWKTFFLLYVPRDLKCHFMALDTKRDTLVPFIKSAKQVRRKPRKKNLTKRLQLFRFDWPLHLY